MVREARRREFREFMVLNTVESIIGLTEAVVLRFHTFC